MEMCELARNSVLMSGFDQEVGGVGLMDGGWIDGWIGDGLMIIHNGIPPPSTILLNHH